MIASSTFDARELAAVYSKRFAASERLTSHDALDERRDEKGRCPA
jgi:hypothetical protein